MTTRVLLIADSADDVRRIRASLIDYYRADSGAPGTDENEEVFHFEHLATLEAGLSRLVTQSFDLILADLMLPDAQGLEVFARLYAQAPALPIVVLVDRADELIGLKAVQHGAQNYIIKDQVHGGLVARTAQYAVQYRATEEALARERERLAVTLRSIGEGVITTDTDGNVTLINRIAEALTGWTQEAGGGQPLEQVFQLIDEDTHQRRESPVGLVLGAGAAADLQPAILVGRTGQHLPVEASAAPIRDREGAIIGVVLAFRDITARRQLEEERLRSSKLESIGNLAGGIAHDFNNLLAGILGNLSLARERSAAGAPVLELVAAAEEATLSARDLARQLLTFASGGAPIKITTTVQELVEDAARLALSGSKVRAELELPGDLWPVEVDEAQLGQALTHLVRNARQALAERGTVRIQGENVDVAATVSAGTAGELGAALAPGRYLKLILTDDGSGIPADIIPHIFDPFFTTRPGASGLGLSIAYSIITRHGGQLSVRSEPGQGSVFQIYLPVAAEPMKQSAPVPPAAAPPVPEDQGPRRILLMDDDDMVRQVAGRMLEWLGYAVTSARDGAEAIELYSAARAARQPFHLVIMDLTIPGGMGGKEAIRQLRQIAPEARALVSSGYFNDPIMANFRDHGFNGVIAKPYQLEDLRDILETALAEA